MIPPISAAPPAALPRPEKRYTLIKKNLDALGIDYSKASEKSLRTLLDELPENSITKLLRCFSAEELDLSVKTIVLKAIEPSLPDLVRLLNDLAVHPQELSPSNTPFFQVSSRFLNWASVQEWEVNPAPIFTYYTAVTTALNWHPAMLKSILNAFEFTDNHRTDLETCLALATLLETLKIDSFPIYQIPGLTIDSELRLPALPAYYSTIKLVLANNFSDIKRFINTFNSVSDQKFEEFKKFTIETRFYEKANKARFIALDHSVALLKEDPSRRILILKELSQYFRWNIAHLKRILSSGSFFNTVKKNSAIAAFFSQLATSFRVCEMFQLNADAEIASTPLPPMPPLAFEWNDTIEVPEEPTIEEIPEPDSPPPEPEVSVPIPAAPTPISEKETLLAEIKTRTSPLGTISAYAIYLGKEIRNKQGKSPTVEEICDHLFLASQNLELFADALRFERKDQVELALQQFLISFHICLEQTLKLHGAKAKECHNLSTLSAAANLSLTAMQKHILGKYRLALLWARYPENYFSQYKTHPELLTWLIDCKEPKKVFEILVRDFQIGLSIIVGESPEMNELLNRMPLAPEKPRPVLKPKSKFQAIKSEIEAVLNHPQIGYLTVPLREIVRHINWMMAAQAMNENYGNDPRLAFHFTHSLLNTDKLFKHLYTADLLMNDLGDVHLHNLNVYRNMLETAGIKKPLQNPKWLRTFNIGIAHHYLRTAESHLTKPCLKLLKQAQNSTLSTGGFTLVSRDHPPQTAALLTTLDQALDFFHQELNQTLSSFKTSSSPPVTSTVPSAWIRTSDSNLTPNSPGK